MKLLRQTSALVLLAAFAVGGLVAPALHRAQHALGDAHRHEAAAASAETAGHVHTDGAALTRPLPDVPGEEPVCVLCGGVSAHVLTVSTWERASLLLLGHAAEGGECGRPPPFAQAFARGPPTV